MTKLAVGGVSTTNASKPPVERGSWAANTAYARGDRYTDPRGMRRDVLAAYTSGPTFGATDKAAAGRLGLGSALNADSGELFTRPDQDASVAVTQQPVWSSTRSFRFGSANQDGLFFIDRFVDNSGIASQGSYTKLFGGGATKNGPGNMDAFWASIAHYGVDEVGIIIGDVTAKAGGAGGNLWGGHLRLAADVAATMRGLLIELVPNVDVTAKTTFGMWVQNAVDANVLTAALRSSGNFTRHIICYSDAAATAIIFDVDQAGNVRAGGTVTPLGNGSQDLGSLANSWRQMFANNVNVNGADSAGVSGGVFIKNRVAAPTRANTNGAAVYSESGVLKVQGTGGDGTTPTILGLSGGKPTLQLQAGAGTGATAALTAGGNDDGGIVTVTIGSAPAAGAQVKVATGVTLPGTPKPVITPLGSPAFDAGLYLTSVGTSGFTVGTKNVPAGNYQFTYKTNP